MASTSSSSSSSSCRSVSCGVIVSNFVSGKLEIGEDSNNYITWKEQMLCLIESEDLLGFINGEIAPPAPSTGKKSQDYVVWRRSDRRVKGWILGALSDQLVRACVGFDTAYGVWLELEDINSVSCGVIASNFVSEKLEIGEYSDNYIPWKEQMLRLLKSQDMLGFIDAPKQHAPEEREKMKWRRNDGLVKGWILGALSDELVRACVRFDTARDVWLELEQILARSKWAPPRGPPPPKVEEETEQGPYTSYGTLLHFQVGPGELCEVIRLVGEYSDKQLKVKDRHGNSALHIAALTGNTAAAKILVKRLPALLNQPRIPGAGRLNQPIIPGTGRLPIHDAALSSHKDILEFFISQITDDFTTSNRVLLLCYIIDAGFYDMALSLLESYPYLARMRDDESNMSALEILSRRELAFRSGARFTFWERLLYFFGDVQLEEEEIGPRPQTSDIEAALGRVEWRKWYKIQIQKLQYNLVLVIDKLVPQSRRILPKILMHKQALKLLQRLCHNLSKEDKAIYNSAMMTAARVGIPEVVEEIAYIFFDTVYPGFDGQHFFQVAAENRSEKVFNLIYQTRDQKHHCSDLRDSSGNNVLHLVAKLAPPHKLNLVSGAALQMQRELQWFKGVENFVHPYAREKENDDGKTPMIVFTEEHKGLKEEGEKWMKDTANSYIIVAALIVTVVFAAAITVPGGNDSNTGYPMLKKRDAFIIFAVSDVGSLFTSITSLLMFLSIMTSRYAEEDFLYALPKRLCIGLFTLFLSIILLMVAFCASTYVVLGRERKLILILVAALASLPVTSFVFLQFPLLWAVVSSTYGHSIFVKKNNYEINHSLLSTVLRERRSNH